jgi:tetratricopeptide (TPR) repeat protein
MKTRTVAFVPTLTLAFALSAFAQDDLQRAKDLYAAAAYEEALAVLTGVPEAERVLQVRQYQAFCLIALGHTAEAQQAIEALLTANPTYQPDPVETSTRVLEVFAEARKNALPDITKRMYVDAKAALERKDRRAAVSGFEDLVRAIDSAPDLAAKFEDLRVLADGFAILSRALPDVSTSAEAAPGPGSAAAQPAEPAQPVASTRPVVVKQEIPAWVPFDGVSRRQAFNGVLRIRVGVDGRVEAAEMIRPVHPGYDKELLRATESWLYKPATENGVPVASDVMVQIQLRPPDS